MAQIPRSWDREKFVLTGSATLAFRGIRDVRDLDILVHPSLKPELTEIPWTESYFGPGSTVQSMADRDIDVFFECPRLGISFDEVKNASDHIGGYYIQSPRHTLAIKALVTPPRAKDQADILALAQIIADEPIRKTTQYAYR